MGREVLRQPPIARSRQRTARRPSAGGNSETDLTGVLAHDLDRDQGGLGDLFAGISTVGEDPLDKWEDAARSLQKRSAAVAILDAGWMGLDDEAAALGVNLRVALAPVDLPARIVTARAAGPVVLTLWLSMIAADGLASRPTRLRSAITSAWFIRSKRPSSRQAANQR